ncbi:MAG: hypothetical protein WA734_04430 [Candidatus Acidiferrales bacterium]
MMRLVNLNLLILLCAAFLAVPVARAQQQPTDQSAPPSEAAQPNASPSPEDQEPTDINGQRLNPDTRSLAGVQTVSLGVPALEHSYWQPSFFVTVAGDSNPLLTPNTTSWTTWTTLLGALDVRANSNHSEFSMDYVGGGSISNDASVQNAIVQELQVGEKIKGRRASLSLLDQVAYIPETSFGYGGLSALSLPGGGALGLQPSLVPNESILSARGQRLLNSSLVEIDALLSPRVTFSVAGGYAFLRDFNNNSFDFDNTIGQAGLSYQMSRQDAIGVLYRFDSFRFTTADATVLGHIAELTYARRITGRLAFEIGAGPEYAIFRVPSPTGSSSTTNIYWVGDAALTYDLRRTSLGLSYDHGIAGGSGVLSGSIADTVTGSITSQLSRTVRGDLSVGYARNEPLSLNTLATPTVNPTFDYYYGTVGISHPFGHSVTLSLSYLSQYQHVDGTYCVGTICGNTILRQQISLGLNVHTRPFPID